MITDKFLFDKNRFKRSLEQENNSLELFKKALKHGYSYLQDNFKSSENIDTIVK